MKRRYLTLAATVAAAAITGWMNYSPHAEQSVLASPTAVVSADVGQLLSGVTVVESLPNVPGYERGCGIDKRTDQREACVFGPAWNDPSDHSGCDTRSRILAAQLHDVTYKAGTRNCKPVSGWLVDPYGGQRITLAQTQIDHVFALSRAWDAGAWRWDLRQRQIFANDPDNLTAASGRLNQQKGDSGLDTWMPPNVAERCTYARQYLSVAGKYNLVISAGDRAAAAAACPQGTS